MTRSERVRVKVRPDELECWKAGAERAGEDLSSFIPAAVEAELEREPLPRPPAPSPASTAGPLGDLLRRYAPTA